MSSEFAEAQLYSISEENQTDTPSRHLGDINFAFQFVFLSTGLEFYVMLLCFYLIFISLNQSIFFTKDAKKLCLSDSVFFFLSLQITPDQHKSDDSEKVYLSPWKAKCLSDCLLYCLSHFFDFPAVKKRVQSGVKIHQNSCYCINDDYM